MNDIFEITMLLDFYGSMLTSKQQNIMNMYYCDDYSLAEIAEQLLISRQGVYDNIKRAREALKEFEEKLGFIKRFYFIKNNTQKTLEMIENIDESEINEKNKSIINNIKAELKILLMY